MPRAEGRAVAVAGAAVTLVAWLLFLVGTVAALHALGGPLSPPPLTDPGGLGRWFDDRQPAEAAFALVRLLTLGLAWYLLTVTVVGTALRLAGAGQLARATDAVTVAMVRRLMNGALAAGVSLAAVTLVGPGPGPGDPALADTATESPVPTMRRLPDGPPPGAAPDVTQPPGVAPAAAPPTAAPPATRTWEVQPGDHFWSVAEKILGQAWSRAPNDDQVDVYWRALMEANRPLLLDPDNPDLLFPGQVITVPAPPAVPA